MSEEHEQEQADDVKDDDKPKFELYIKASTIDGDKKGSCPICQQWFMIAFLLAEENNCSFRVYTVEANKPPKSYTDLTSSKTFPVVRGLGGKDKDGADITNLVYDSVDEVEKFFESVTSTRNCQKLKRTHQKNTQTLRVFEDLYKDFKLFLQNEYSNGEKLIKDLKNIDGFLEEEEEVFLTDSSLTYADCSLLPKLQHIRVAGKASLIDGEMKGSCPICQQWFMIAFLLAEENNCGFKVYTVQANMPPKSFLQKTLSKTFPVVIGLGGKNNNGADITDLVYDSFDEVEQFFESVNFDCPKLKRTQQVNALPLKIFADLYKDFKLFLQNEHSDGKKLIHDLEKINEFLEEQEQPFLNGPSLTYADCSLLPKLHHIRIAGEYFRDFEIPETFSHLLDYLERGCQTKAFSFTMPSDQDILLHYENIAKGKPLKGRPTLQKLTFTCNIPRRNVTVNGGQKCEEQVENGDE